MATVFDPFQTERRGFEHWARARRVEFADRAGLEDTPGQELQVGGLRVGFFRVTKRAIRRRQEICRLGFAIDS